MKFLTIKDLKREKFWGLGLPPMTTDLDGPKRKSPHYRGRKILPIKNKGAFATWSKNRLK
jgi:hypothetical protein